MALGRKAPKHVNFLLKPANKLEQPVKTNRFRVPSNWPKWTDKEDNSFLQLSHSSSRPLALNIFQQNHFFFQQNHFLYISNTIEPKYKIKRLK